MRPARRVFEISDGSSYVPPPSIEGGWYASTESLPMNPLAPILIYAVDKTDVFSPVPPLPWAITASPRSYYLPMTTHQRLYQWPDSGVGPHVVVEGLVKDGVPAELPPGMAPWAIRPLPPVISSSDPVTKNWTPLTQMPGPKAPPIQYEAQVLFSTKTIRKDNPHFAYFIRGGWIGPSSQDAFYVSGITKNSAGAPLGGCTVILFDADRLIPNQDILANPVVATTVSNVSTGAYSIPVRGGRNYQAIGYLPGSPDVAGVTRKDVQAVVT